MNQLLTMGIESWDLNRASPGWVRDRFAAVDHYTPQEWEFDIAEILLTEVFNAGNSDYYFLSLMVNGEDAEVQHLDLGYGTFLRPPVPGNLVFVDVNIAKDNSGRGPYHVLTTRMKGGYVRQRLLALWNTDSLQFRTLLKGSFFEPEIESLMWQLLAVGRGAPSIITGPEIIDLILGTLLRIAGNPSKVMQKLARSHRAAKLQKALTFVGEHFRSKIRKDELTLISGLSDKQLGASFQSELGMSGQEYLRRFRLNRVRELLRSEPTMSVREVAQHCGFYDERDLYPGLSNSSVCYPASTEPMTRDRNMSKTEP